MADFSDKKLRTAFDSIISTASAEDLALLAATIKPLLAAKLARIQEMSQASITGLDPLPVKPASTPKGDE